MDAPRGQSPADDRVCRNPSVGTAAGFSSSVEIRHAVTRVVVSNTPLHRPLSLPAPTRCPVGSPPKVILCVQVPASRPVSRSPPRLPARHLGKKDGRKTNIAGCVLERTARGAVGEAGGGGVGGGCSAQKCLCLGFFA